MGIQIGAKPDAGFDDPIGMLHDCHRRIEHFLNIVCVVVNRAGNRALTEEECAAIQAALHYFRTGGPRHNADEEQSLFPRMRAAGAASDELGKIGGLEHDHRDAEVMHAKVDELYSAWIANGSLNSEQHGELAVATARLQQFYRDHIDLEEKVVFPRAAQMLDSETISAMGQEFQARRDKGQ
ncbi:MAG TPA: hemerythrin domain-containing protein [Terracidiphilus sp.]|jgi:hemerythrin-like domain-containing protein